MWTAAGRVGTATLRALLPRLRIFNSGVVNARPTRQSLPKWLARPCVVALTAVLGLLLPSASAQDRDVYRQCSAGTPDQQIGACSACLLYTSDAADERSSVD